MIPPELVEHPAVLALVDQYLKATHLLRGVLQYCQPWLRPIGNMVLSAPPKTAAQYSKQARSMLDDDLMGMSFMAYVDGRNPCKLVEAFDQPD